MLRFISILQLILFIWYLPEKSPGPLVSTNSGKIRGHHLISYKGNIYEAYQGIPYALPPIGERRFSSPVPVEQWSDELQAMKIKDACLHDFRIQRNKPVTGSEDCLYLNVYVPMKKKSDNASLPVLFYIYGGGFKTGGAIYAQESYVIDYDVIFVSVNYRSGSLGFLSTEDEVVPGNMGLKDQSMALQWIYKNIEHFGGDHKRITLIGGSSGGACVHYHYLSAWSRGLFHAGISLSGSTFGPFAVAERSREKTIAFGRLVNCTDNDVRQLVKCLRNVSADVLVDAQNKQELWLDFPTIFGPVVEKSSTDPFIDDYPSEILKKGKAYDVPWVTGLVSGEGAFYTADYTPDILKYMDKNWDSLAPLILDYLYTIPEEQYGSVARRIRSHYFGEKSINKENLQILTELLGDRYFSVGAVNAAKTQATANESPVYFYYYSYRAVDSHIDGKANSKDNLGVAHGDDVHLIVRNPRISPAKLPNDMAMHRRLIQICTSLAYNGVPEIDAEWPRVTPNNSTTTLDYLHIIGPENLVSESNDNFAQRVFWNSIGFDEK